LQADEITSAFIKFLENNTTFKSDFEWESLDQKDTRGCLGLILVFFLPFFMFSELAIWWA
jgi:hypothetical protein